MSVKLNRFAMVALAIVTIALACSKTASPKPVAATSADTKSTQFAADSNSIGLIEHRGRFYRMEDLMNPAYRAASNDSFIKNFCSETKLVTPWAGMSPEEEISPRLDRRGVQVQRLDLNPPRPSLRARDQRIQPLSIPWAGRNLRDHVDRD